MSLCFGKEMSNNVKYLVCRYSIIPKFAYYVCVNCLIGCSSS